MGVQQETSFTTIDRLQLAATVTMPDQGEGRVVVLVHGGGVTRHEGGFFTRLADGLAACGVASLRFDLRGHGQSQGRVEDLTLAAVLNDIHTAIATARTMTGARSVSLLGTSFGGGICAYYAAHRPTSIDRLVLFNPQLDYKRRTITNSAFWHDDVLDAAAASDLDRDGYLQFTPTIRHGRAIFHEVFWFDVLGALPRITAPTLLVHGTRDTLVPIEGTEAAVPLLTCEHRFVRVEGCQHGFAAHDDPTYADPRSKAWQAQVITTTTDWITRS